MVRPEEDPQVIHFHYVAQLMRLRKHHGLSAIARAAMNERIDEIKGKRDMSNLEKFASVLPSEARITKLFAQLHEARQQDKHQLARLRHNELTNALRELARRVSQ